MTQYSVTLYRVNVNIFSFHIHHHFHHQEVASVPSYNIKSDGEIIDARFVFPSSRTGPRGSNVTLIRGDAVLAV